MVAGKVFSKVETLRFLKINDHPTPHKTSEIGGALPQNSCCSPESMSTDKSNIDIPSGKNFPCVE
jgi:hypothetical protein